MLQESFDGLSSLKELHLDHNRVEEIQPGAFTQLGFLNMLALTHNQLVYIPNMAFQVSRTFLNIFDRELILENQWSETGLLSRA